MSSSLWKKDFFAGWCDDVILINVVIEIRSEAVLRIIIGFDSFSNQGLYLAPFVFYYCICSIIGLEEQKFI